MDANNPVVKLCADGMMAEGQGRGDVARALFERAWAARTDAFDACVAAHYLARHQGSPEATLNWNREALSRAEAAGDDRVRGFFPSLYLNLGLSYEDVGDLDKARRTYDLAAETVGNLDDDGYGAMIRRGIAAARQRTSPPEPA
ncbi:MAG: hypothetical protein JWO59_2904 [Chloroflexi bacterium]|nr:hypothetical protein [Chloroflexota bacterium]